MNLAYSSSSSSSTKWELFNLKQDPAELNDLSKQHPGKLKEMVELWEQYKRENKVLDISMDMSGF